MGRPASEPSDYDQGVNAGRIDARLADHDRHLAKINGSMDRVADEMHQLVLAVQHLGDAAEADRATVIARAAALKEAEDTRRAQSETRWTPAARLITVIVAVAAVAGVIIAYFTLHNGG